MDIDELSGIDISISLRCAHASVSEERLYSPHIAAAGEEVCSESVSESVRRCRLIES